MEIYLTTPKTTYLRRENAAIFTENTKSNLIGKMNGQGNSFTLDMSINENNDSIMAYEIFKKTNDGEYEFWGMTRDGKFKIDNNLDKKIKDT